MSQEGESAIRRKLSGNRVGRAPIPGVDEIGEAFARLLDEGARGLVRTITSAIVLECEVRKLSAVLEEIAMPAMLAVVRVEGSQTSALVNLGMDLVYHVVDLRMGGDASAAPAPVARSVTAIDMALCEDFVSLALAAFRGALERVLGTRVEAEMTLGHFEQHVTMVRIAPEQADVLVLKLGLDLGEAARSGGFEFVLPLSALDSLRPRAAREASAARALSARPDVWTARMTRAAAEAPLRMHAVLHREEMPLTELQALEPGMLMPLPRDCREGVELIVEGDPRNAAVALGRLGGIEGMKAVKVTPPPDAATMRELGALIAPAAIA